MPETTPELPTRSTLTGHKMQERLCYLRPI